MDVCAGFTDYGTVPHMRKLLRVRWSLPAVVVVPFVVLVAVTIGVLLAHEPSSSGGSSTSAGVTLPTAPAAQTNATTANIASLSIARAALYLHPKARVTGADVIAAAKTDHGTVMITHNYGTVKANRSLIQYRWDFGGAPILVCVYEPSSLSAGAPYIIQCPPKSQLGTATIISPPAAIVKQPARTSSTGAKRTARTSSTVVTPSRATSRRG